MITTRRLAAIVAADIAGYSRLIGSNEASTLGRLRAIRAELIDPAIATHHGRLVKTTGDGLLVEFGSVIDGLRCATEIQAGMAERNATAQQDERIEFRMGLNVGDIVVEDGDIFGDGVNVAARLESLAEPGGICVSARVREDAAGKLDIPFRDIGEQQLKNIARPVHAYEVTTPKDPSVLPPPRRTGSPLVGGGVRRRGPVITASGLATATGLAIAAWWVWPWLSSPLVQPPAATSHYKCPGALTPKERRYPPHRCYRLSCCPSPICRTIRSNSISPTRSLRT
jgi:class 3 adenylate cyclase